MGINFQAGHADDILGKDSPFPALLRARFGPNSPLGTPGLTFVLRDEMAWSWWSELQRFATEQFGDRGSQQVSSIDAWLGVYVDAEIDRELLWPPRKSPAVSTPPTTVPRARSGGILAWIRHLVGLERGSGDGGNDDTQHNQAVQQMIERYGTRKGEQGALQVGNLRSLMKELNELLGVLKVEASQAAVQSLLDRYSADDRFDEDGHIQCLCHAWLTANQALSMGAPLWLVK